MFDLIPIILIFLSLAAIIVILVRKFPSLANIDLGQVPQEKEAQLKHLLIENRFHQKLNFIYKNIKNLFAPLRNLVINFFNNLKQRILVFEKKHQEKKNQLIRENSKEVPKKIEILMAEGKELEESNNLIEAEKKYIEIINLDKENIAGYKALGNIYFQEKNYEHAKETFKHILKIISPKKRFLSPEETAQAVEIYLDLGLIHKTLGKNKEALLKFQKAFFLEPNNPKVLDFLIEISIILKNKNLAKKYLENLKKANPENEKIGEFERRVASL